MATKKIAACFYPTTIALVDDEPNFLRNLHAKLKNTYHLVCQTFQEPKEFLDFFQSKQSAWPFLSEEAQTWIEEEKFDNRIISINIQSIHKKIFDAMRFEGISVILCDYAMPLIDGLEVLRRLETTNPIKKILLTGEADEKTAVTAFNEGLIQGYVRKGSNNFYDELIPMIQEAQKAYFQDLSEFIIKSLTKEKNRHSCLDDPIFINFFNELIQKKHIQEYYLYDENGSFLLIDAKGKIQVLIIKNNELMEADYEIAIDYHKEVDPVDDLILKDLKEKNRILFAPDSHLSPNEWKNFLYPVKTLQGRDQYYYGLIDLSRDPQFEDVLFYEKYLKQI